MKPLLIALLTAATVCAQTYRVPLEIRNAEPSGMALGHDIVADDATHAHSALPFGGTLLIERLPAPARTILIKAPDADPPAVALLPEQVTIIELPRAIGQLKSTRYWVLYHVAEYGGAAHEALMWMPYYRAEGRLQLPACQLNLAVFDVNGDGVFDSKDSRQATTLAIDFNGDGRFSGNDWHRMAEILDVCGSPLEVADLDPAGASITFRVADRKPPSVGDPVPEFSVPTVDGKSLRSSAMRGTVTLLDFWASWCNPCVAELDDIAALSRQYSKGLRVYGINVDEPSRRAAAERIVHEKASLYPQVIREQGEKDFLWKLFGSMSGARLSIPLFVVVDGEGRIQYAAHGGNQLADLKLVLERLLPAQK